MKQNIRWILLFVTIGIGCWFAYNTAFKGLEHSHLATFFLGVAAVIQLAFSLPPFLSRYPKPSYAANRKSGKKSFNYKLNDGVFDIGLDEYLFKTRWSSLSENSINLRSSDLEAAVLASGLYEFTEVRNAKELIDNNSPITDTRIHEAEFVVAKNKRGNYACIRVVDVKMVRRGGDAVDEVTLEWLINPDRKTDFS